MAFIINGEQVDDEVIEAEFDAIKQHYQNLGEVVCCDRDDEFMGYARENVVNRTLLRQASREKFGEVKEADIDAMIERLKQDHGGEEAFYKNTGYSHKDDLAIRRKVSDTLSVDKILESELGPDPDPSDEDLKAFYEDHIDKYLTPEEVRASHIFKEPKNHDEAEVAIRTLREAREKALNGADFHALAGEISEKGKDETDLGFFKRGEMMHEIETITFSMREGEVSPVISTHFGYHIFKLTGRKKPEPVPFEEVRDQVKEAYLETRRETVIQGLLDSLKRSAKIEEVAPQHEEV